MKARIKLIAAVVAPLLIAAGASAQTLGIGTSAQGSLQYGLGSAIANAVSQKSPVRAVVQPYGGTSSYVPLLNQGRVDFGVINIMEATFARTGAGIFEGRPHPKIQLASGLIEGNVSLLVRQDSGIQSAADLRGKRFTWGYSSMAMVQFMLQGILANLGLDEADIQKVPVPNIVRAADDLAAGRADVSFHAVGTAQVEQVAAAVGGVRYISLDPAPERAAAMQKLVPGTYVNELRPSPRNTGVAGPTNFMGYQFTLAVNEDVPDEQVYEVVKAMHANKAIMASSHGAMNRFSPERMAAAAGGPMPFHDGAIKFYREVGIWKE